MRLFLYLVALLSLWFVAGVYHVMALMALAVGMALLLVCMFVLSQLTASLLAVRVERADGAPAKRGSAARFELCAQNRSPLPVSAFDVQLQLSYRDGQAAPTRLVVGGVVGGRTQVGVPVAVDAPHCGVLQVAVRRLSARDPLGLFVAHRRPRGASAQVVVVPGGSGAPRVPVEGGTATTHGPQGGSEVRRRGTVPPDVEQVRPYRAGDPLHAIHWKLSARTAEPMVKEHPSEHGLDALLLCDLGLRQGARCPAEDFDAFADAVGRTARGLVRAHLSYAVAWMGAHGTTPQVVVVRGEGEVEGVLQALVEGGVPYEVPTRWFAAPGRGDGGRTGTGVAREENGVVREGGAPMGADASAGAAGALEDAGATARGIAAQADGRRDLALLGEAGRGGVPESAGAGSSDWPCGVEVQTDGGMLCLRLDLDLSLWRDGRIVARLGQGGAQAAGSEAMRAPGAPAVPTRAGGAR